MAAQGEESAAKKARLDTPPIFQTLQDFAQGSKPNEKRYEHLVAKFEERYARKPDFVARAPGRVNIIGEHIDYSGYAVLPMAIEQDIAIACSCSAEQVVRLANTSEESYPEHSCPPQADQITIEGHQWYNYFLCGYKGLVESADIRNPVGMDVLVEGNIPPSAGLSSSSAVVCCAALTAAHANKITMPSKKSLAELCAKSEHYIGTEGGGMDQAISFLGEQNKALLIEFNPIRHSEVDLPSGACFVISNTRVQANKVAFASFNERVAECRLAAMVVAKAEDIDWKQTRKLGLLQSALSLELQEMKEVISARLHEKPYSRDEICRLLGISDEELKEEYLHATTTCMQSFELFKRATHVFTEASRVYEFQATANSLPAGPSTAAQLGQLMDASHESCSQLYECSCPELDRLVALCKSSGALGSRLTGAGWGGCAVSLVEESRLEGFLGAVAAGYYGREEAVVAKSLFATSPGPGAALWDIT